MARRLPAPRFYADCAESLQHSLVIFEGHELVLRCRGHAERSLTDDFGHGVDHSRKVAVEGGAIIIEEQKKKGYRNHAEMVWIVVLAQIGGLLHDIRRRDKDHAKAGASAADQLLKQWNLGEEARRFVVLAISNHEAFVVPEPVVDSGVLNDRGQLISDALYDADKFRWGPDNFTETLWLMAATRGATPQSVLERYSHGMKSIRNIKYTFRSSPGKRYGPEFIDQGLDIGRKIHERMIRAVSEARCEELNDV
ncbi:MAG: hypothetical protein JRG73_05425 [Deltaproteobacteria bacterium]|nr:hypothetical protein [Deltaproteobacteria bacterium]